MLKQSHFVTPRTMAQGAWHEWGEAGDVPLIFAGKGVVVKRRPSKAPLWVVALVIVLSLAALAVLL